MDNKSKNGPDIEEVEFLNELGDATVDPELLSLHVELEIAGTSSQEFKDAFGNT